MHPGSAPRASRRLAGRAAPPSTPHGPDERLSAQAMRASGGVRSFAAGLTVTVSSGGCAGGSGVAERSVGSVATGGAG
eukprot:5941180-Prymnesium_polylepis.1